MNIIYLLIALAILFVILFVIFFIWAAAHGQYDDLETPAKRILLDDED